MILKQAILANLNVSHNIATIMMRIMMKRQNVSVEKHVKREKQKSNGFVTGKIKIWNEH